MKVLVTGGAGFIGSRLVERLLDRVDDVTCLDTAKLRGHAVRNVQASVLDRDATVAAVRGHDAVVHLAGFVRGGIRREPYQGAAVHLHGTLNVLEACRTHDVQHLTYASSYCVYHGLSTASTVSEDTPLDPLRMELFGATKLMGEALCTDWGRRCEFRVVNVRPGPVYGGTAGSSAVDEFVRSGLAGQEVRVWGDGQRRNQYTYIDDVIEGLTNTLDSPSDTYNLVAPQAVSLQSVARQLADEYGFKAVFDRGASEEATYPYIASDKAIAQLKWRPSLFVDGLRRLLARATSGAANVAQ